MYTSDLLQWAAEFATEMSWSDTGQVASAWCSGKFVHLWVDVPASDRKMYERTVEAARDTLDGMFGDACAREIDHGSALKETVFEPVSEFSVTVQMKADLNEEGD